VLPSLPSKESDDNLSITVYNEALRLINRIGLEKYISGTVEAEGGSVAFPEYYKAQAVIARTFAIKNFHRHAHEGFNLCDGVHCQAYNGKSRMNRQIYASVLATKDEILTDLNGKPAIAAYHACCGGITASASVEWNRNLPYLVPVKDPFCSGSKHHSWTKTIPLKEWITYLEKSDYYTSSDNLYKFNDSGRHKYLDEKNKRLPLAEIRKAFQLKSSYFYVTAESDQITFHGHGYGHGLGLCQEGGMEMARVGYTYVDILMFYYRNVKIAISKP
jgi:stage II sporulation protein D